MPIEHDKLPVAGCRLPFSLHAVAASVLLCASASAFASAEDEAELALAYGDKDFISLATGSKQLVSRAPAVATVITAQDIAATGARNIDEALQACQACMYRWAICTTGVRCARRAHQIQPGSANAVQRRTHYQPLLQQSR
ncbi:MAG: hypothetical protein IPH37_08790 [Burkholderiales bacterium]|nr:hypothetical protein [Burkholderiales bacterium]